MRPERERERVVKWTERLKGKQSEIKTDIERKIWDRRVFLPPQLSCEEPNQRKVGPQSGRDMTSQMERLSNTKRMEAGKKVLCKRPLFIEGEQDLAR